MYSSKMAEWLDTFFAGYDHFFLNILHVMGDKAGGVLTPLMRVITFIGEKGIVFFLLALLFMLMADKRDLGVCIFGAVCCGALITNIILKDSVGRVRPFEAVAEYNEWWQALGAPSEDGCSFPSGHVTACAAGMTAITLMRGKKWILPSVLIVFVMGVSRNYLMAHYPSDVLFAAIIGVFSGVVAWLITQMIFRFLNRNRRNIPLCATLLDFDIRDVLPISLPGSGSGRGRTKAAQPARASRAAAPARRGAKRVREEPEEEAFDEDVKTYSGSGRRAAPAAAEESEGSTRSPIFSEPAPRRSRASESSAETASRRSRASERNAEPAPRRSRASENSTETASRRTRATAENSAEAEPRRVTRAAEEELAEAEPSLVQAEEEAPAEAPRRVRSGGSHSISSRASAGSGGRHALNASGQDSAPRAARSVKKARLPGGYQGKHVK